MSREVMEAETQDEMMKRVTSEMDVPALKCSNPFCGVWHRRDVRGVRWSAHGEPVCSVTCAGAYLRWEEMVHA